MRLFAQYRCFDTFHNVDCLHQDLYNIHKDATIDSIEVIAVDTMSTTEDATVYHWFIRARIKQNSGKDGDEDISATVVVFNIVPGADGRTGVLIVTSESANTPNSDSNSEKKIIYSVKLSSSPSEQIKISTLLNLLLTNELDKYIYDELGSGCRWWCTVVLQVAESEGVIEKGSLDGFEKFVERTREENPLRVPMPIRKGRFYDGKSVSGGFSVI